jgi:hypothetical protein
MNAVAKALLYPPVSGAGSSGGWSGKDRGMLEPDQRESERFRALVLPVLDEVYTFARYLTRDAVEAEDAAQETFLRALRYFSGFSGDQVKPWLFTILRNVLRSRDPQRFEPQPEAQGGEPISVEPLLGRAGVQSRGECDAIGRGTASTRVDRPLASRLSGDVGAQGVQRSELPPDR